MLKYTKSIFIFLSIILASINSTGLDRLKVANMKKLNLMRQKKNNQDFSDPLKPYYSDYSYKMNKNQKLTDKEEKLLENPLKEIVNKAYNTLSLSTLSEQSEFLKKIHYFLRNDKIKSLSKLCMELLSQDFTYLNLSNKELTNSQFEFLINSRKETLTNLDLSYSKLTKSQFELLVDLLKKSNTTLTSLDLSDSKLTESQLNSSWNYLMQVISNSLSFSSEV